MLGAVVSQGTGRGAALAVPAFGKTGTTQDSRDALFIGFAQDLVVGVWVGNDDNSPMPGAIAGGGLPARIWRDFMTQAIGTGPAQSLAPPLAAPVESQGINGSVTLPIEGTDYQVGVQVDENGVTVSAQPGETPQPGDQPAERPAPTITPPPAPPAPDDEPAEDDGQ